ncbi:MAG TPA: hypothetical protein PKM56_01095 [Candidatus Rifleibacterium sp.]|nr:hypothetical protein [Candidatus Rifleibacterium sp.]
MNKKTCCGCFGLGCLFVVVAFVVGGYFGLGILHESGREYAADGLEKSIAKVTELAFNDADRQEINKSAIEIAAKVRNGEVGLVELLSNTTRQLETNLHVKAMLLAFYRQNKLSGESGTGVPVDQEGSETVRRLIFGMTANRIPVDQIASVTALIVERYTETVSGNDGKVKHKISLQRLKTGLTQAELKESLAVMKKIVDLQAIESPDASFDAVAAVKSDFMKFFANFAKDSKNGKDGNNAKDTKATKDAEPAEDTKGAENAEKNDQ